MTAEEATDALRLCAAIFKDSAEHSRTDDGFSGVLRPDSSRVAALSRLDALGLVNGVRRSGRRVTVEAIAQEVGDIPIHVDIVVPRSSAAFFAHDIADLLESPANRLARPAAFYIAALDFNSAITTPAPGPVLYYERTLKLVGVLTAMADHVATQATERTLIFLGKEGKLEVPIIYTASDLRPLPGLDGLEQTLVGPPHEDVKRTLFRSALIQLTAEYPTPKRLPTVLDSFDVLTTRFSENYDLFVSGFSFETELAKVHEAKREYLIKLNGALNDVHAKLIAIPVAVVLVGGQMKSDGTAAATLQNAVLLAGAVVFAVLMLMITANQRHSLRSIKQDYEAREGRLRAELPARLYAQTRKAFEDLNKRYVLLRRMLFAVDGVVILGLLFSIGVFVWMRREATTTSSAATTTPASSPPAVHPAPPPPPPPPPARPAPSPSPSSAVRPPPPTAPP